MRTATSLISILKLIALAALCTACSHTIDFRASHFAIPIVSDEQGGGYFSISGSQPTKVKVISDRASNPPGRDFAINEEDIAEDFFETLFAVDLIGIELGVSVLPSLEIYTYGGSLFGLKWQLIGDSKQGNGLVASIQGGYGKFSTTSSSGSTTTTEEAKSAVTTTQYGGSLGYKAGSAVFYVSHIQNAHSVETDVVNPSGTFGPYEDSGIHGSTSIGISTYAKALLIGLEYTITKAVWDPDTTLAPNHNGAEDQSEGGGIRIGLKW